MASFLTCRLFRSLRRLAYLYTFVLISFGSARHPANILAAEWQPVGLSGGGAMFAPAISPADSNLMMLNCDMGGAYLSDDGGHNWRMIHHAQLRSDISCRPGFHPTNANIIFASSNGQLRRSSDRGQTFVPIGNLPESLQGEIAIDSENADRMIVGSHSGRCWLSNDGGNSWQPGEGPRGNFLGFHFDRSRPGQIVFAASDQGIWRSDDSGRGWSSISSPFRAGKIQGFAAASNPQTKQVVLYCAVESELKEGRLTGGIFRSEDRGTSWQSAMGDGINVETSKADEWAAGPVAQYHQILVSDASPFMVYALNTSTGFHPPHHETVYRSNNGGKTWRATYYQDPRFASFNIEAEYEVASTGQSFKGGGTPFGAAICNTDPDRVMLVMNECHITHNGGVNWFNGSTYPAPGSPRKPGAEWICNGQVVTTTWHYYVDPHDPRRHYIAYTDIGFARSVDRGKSWIWWDKKSWAPWRNTCYELAFDPETPGLIWGAFSNVHDIPNDNIISERHGHNGPGGVCISHDFGASWKNDTQDLPLKPVTSIAIDPHSPRDARILYAGLFEGGVYQSQDSGKRWTAKNNGLGDPDNMRVCRVLLHGDGTLFALVCAKRSSRGKPLMPAGVGLYRSGDKAQTWQKVNVSQLFLYPKDFSVAPTDSNEILIGVCDTGAGDQSGGLYRTVNGGQTWTRIGRKGPQTFGGYFHPKHPNWIYMTLTEGAPGAGLWFSDDDGRNWKSFRGLPFATIQRVEFDPVDEKQIYVTTFGGGVWRGPARE